MTNEEFLKAQEQNKVLEDAKKFAEQLYEDIKEPVEVAPKNKTNKPSWHIFPFDEAEEVRKVFEWGALPKNYKAPFTYRKGSGVPENDLWDATFRHLLAIQRGEDCASDSLLLHWAHVAANALMAIATFKKRQSLT